MSWLDKVLASRSAGLLEPTLQILQQELLIRPNDPEIFYQFAWTHDALGKEADAAPAYEQAIALGLSGESLKGAYVGLGSTYRCLGRYEESLRLLERAESEFPDERVFRVFKSLAAYNLGRHNEAVGILIRELAETSSNKSIARYKRALTFYSDKLAQTFD